MYGYISQFFYPTIINIILKLWYDTIKYYFDSVVKLQVSDSSGKLQKVPVQYASPENWKSFQKSEIKRDSRGKIQLPILVFKRDSIEKDRNLGSKVDASRQIYTVMDRGFDRNNRFDRFGVVNGLQGRQKHKHYQKIIVPDY